MKLEAPLAKDLRNTQRQLQSRIPNRSARVLSSLPSSPQEAILSSLRFVRAPHSGGIPPVNLLVLSPYSPSVSTSSEVGSTFGKGPAQTQRQLQSRRPNNRSVWVLSLRTVEVAVAEIQFRVVQNVRDVGGESKALVIVQQHFATIRLQAAD